RSIQISYSTYSRRLAREVQLLLLQFGVVSRICEYEKGEHKVVISNRRDARLFARRIGFYGAKQEKLQRELSALPERSRSLTRDASPFGAVYRPSESGSRRTDRDWLRRHNIDRAERWERGGAALLDRIASDEVRRVVEPLVTGDYYYATVSSVEDAGVQP